MHLLNNRLGRVSALLVLGSAVAMAQGTQTANVTGTVVSSSGGEALVLADREAAALAAGGSMAECGAMGS